MTEADAREAAIEAMAREGRTDEEWDRESFAYIKLQRQTAERMLSALLEGQYVLLRDQLEPKSGHLIVIERDPETDDDLAWYGPYSDIDTAIAVAHSWRGEYGNAFSVGKLFDSPAVFRPSPAEIQEPQT